ncbi:putative limd1 [Aphelenchoides fujianensis]|nr:putative limd1 [Aphelenchoides fujianensis]
MDLHEVLKANRPKNPYYEPLHPSATPPKITIVPISPSPPTTKKTEEKPRRYSPLEVTPIKTVQERPSKVRHVDVPRSDSPRGARSIWDQVREEAAAVHLRELDLEADRQRRLAPFGGHSSTTDEFSSPSTYYFSDEGSTEEVEKAVDTRKNEEQTIVQRNEPPTCARCKKHIHDMILQAIGENWHPSCFRCAECNRCLDGVPFAVDGQNHVFCMEDYERLFVPICARCERAIRPSNPYGQIVRVVAMDREYHMPKDREKSEKKKKKKTTSDDILASLVEEIRTVEDISVLIKKDKKPKEGEEGEEVKGSGRRAQGIEEGGRELEETQAIQTVALSGRQTTLPIAGRPNGSGRPLPSDDLDAALQRRRRPSERTENTRPFSRFTWGRARSRDREGFLPWERDRWSRSRSRSWSPTRYLRRDRSKSPRPREIDESRIDKHELLRIARKNVTRLAAEGRLPKGMELGSTLKNKSIRELIELCYEIQSRDFEVPVPESFVPSKDDEEDKSDFSTLPVRSIRIRIKDGAEKSTRSNLERMIEENALRSHFPISSGQTHKNTADKEWVPMDDAVPNGGIVSTPPPASCPSPCPNPAPLLVVSNEEFMAEAEEPVASTSALG